MNDKNRHFCKGCVWGKSCNDKESLIFCMFPECVVPKNQTKAAIISAVTYKIRKKWK